MRIKLYFKLEYPTLDVQYKKGIISFIKHSVQMYDENLFKEMYKDNNKKTFAFAPILPAPKFEDDKIILASNQYTIIFTIYDYSYALHIYNAFINKKFEKFSLNKNSMTLTNIVMIPEHEIKSNSINVKMLSPIICRNHNKETLKDFYYSFEREEFEKYIKINISEQMQKEHLDESLLDNFKITPIQGKKIIVKLYEKKIESSIGTYKIDGNTKLLDYLYRAGIGSKKAMGFRSV